ncbi:MAG TPA: molybdopterin dinucleotide binding domain-containing protein, partial [Deferrisomatales bacterium]|nr:molybdopterin dinucleotide binding domain-containing protein [Deferrisomatales bacterium]
SAPTERAGLTENFTKLQADGSTSSGNWLYSGSFTEAGNMMARRGTEDPTGLGMYHNWSWCWPVNRRILYNRASLDAEGRPYDPRRAVIAWNGEKWTGDVPDGGWPPLASDKGKRAFIMKPDGVASLFGPGLKDGPFPEHYEALECPVPGNLMSSQRINPVIKLWFGAEGDKAADVFASCDARFPLVATTYRVTEHWQTGVMSRNTPWLLEMQPHLFVEISKELGRERGIRSGDPVQVVSARGSVDALAIVTRRFKPYRVQDSTVHQVGIPWCFGWTTPGVGDSANLLTPTTGDPNTLIPETKAFMVDVRKKV